MEHWLVVTGTWLNIFPIRLGISSSQLTFIFFRGVGIPTTNQNIYIYMEHHHFQWANPLFRLGHFPVSYVTESSIHWSFRIFHSMVPDLEDHEKKIQDNPGIGTNNLDVHPS